MKQHIKDIYTTIITSDLKQFMGTIMLIEPSLRAVILIPGESGHGSYVWDFIAKYVVRYNVLLERDMG